MESILSVKSLSKGYERTVQKALAVSDVSLELHSGEILGNFNFMGCSHDRLETP